MHGGGSNGWWTLQSLTTTDTEITGHISFNFIDNPAVHIERTTGLITIKGMHASFSGQCNKVDPSARKF